MARHRPPHACRKCHYSLAGLPRQCTCPECGLYNDADYNYPTTVRQWVRTYPGRLAIGLRDASPWLAERYLPSYRTTTTIITVLGHSAILIAIGLIIANALTGGEYFRSSPTPAAAGPSLFSEMIATTLQWAPLLFALYALATAFQGIIRHRIQITGNAIVTGYQARAFGLFALAAAAGLLGLFTWMRVSIP